eukprot:2877937-Pleurochrysis_carterae.AAC.2
MENSGDQSFEDVRAPYRHARVNRTPRCYMEHAHCQPSVDLPWSLGPYRRSRMRLAQAWAVRLGNRRRHNSNRVRLLRPDNAPCRRHPDIATEGPPCVLRCAALTRLSPRRARTALRRSLESAGQECTPVRGTVVEEVPDTLTSMQPKLPNL